jgi:UDP-hydrolysing UDP-N-acetyl-D-glucosamine 2-epimerase
MTQRRVAIVTGSRAEFSLLTPVIRAIGAREELEAMVVVAGSHLVPPALSKRDVAALFPIAAEVPMQEAGVSGRMGDARALGRGVVGIADALERLGAAWVVVLGDRIEALAGALAASVGGVAVAHIHGGDRAEGVADDAMRHAITKMAHVHLAATRESADRIVRMGEDAGRVHVVGSPAIDAVMDVRPMDDAAFDALGRPEVVMLVHPVGAPDAEEHRTAEACMGGVRGRRVVWMAPNTDAGREGIEAARRASAGTPGVVLRDHLPAPEFRSVIARVAREGGVMVGNSSGALIEAAALRCPAVDVGPRQAHRERGTNTVRVERATADAVREAVAKAMAMDRAGIVHPFGDGRAADRIAAVLAGIDPGAFSVVRKINAY